MATDFTQRNIAPYLADCWEQGALPRDLYQRAAALGLLERGAPESAGDD